MNTGQRVISLARRNRGASSMATTSERRRYDRPPIKALAWIRFRGDHTVWATTTTNLTEEGAQFTSYTPVKTGEPLMLHVQPRGNMSPLECKGQIIWCALADDGLYRFGVRIVDLCDDERTLIRGAVGATARQALQSA
jgi:hypothetical protein